MTVKGGTTPACAACKYQRRRCISTCPLAPYFPATQQQKFVNVHKLFGVSNVTKTLRNLETKDLRDDAMKSMIFEADMREAYPVYGCSYVIFQLRLQIQYATQELMRVLSDLERVKEARVNHNKSDLDIRRYTTSVESIPGSSDVPLYRNSDFYQSVEDMTRPIPAVLFYGRNATVTSNNSINSRDNRTTNAFKGGGSKETNVRGTSNNITVLLQAQMNAFGIGSKYHSFSIEGSKELAEDDPSISYDILDNVGQSCWYVNYTPILNHHIYYCYVSFIILS